MKQLASNRLIGVFIGIVVFGSNVGHVTANPKCWKPTETVLTSVSDIENAMDESTNTETCHTDEKCVQFTPPAIGTADRVGEFRLLIQCGNCPADEAGRDEAMDSVNGYGCSETCDLNYPSKNATKCVSLKDLTTGMKICYKHNGEKMSAEINDESEQVYCLDSCQYVENKADNTIFVGCEKDCEEFATDNSLSACADCPLDGCKAQLQDTAADDKELHQVNNHTTGMKICYKHNGERISAELNDESQQEYCLDSCQYVENEADNTIFVGCEKECEEFATDNSLSACMECPLDGCKAQLQDTAADDNQLQQLNNLNTGICYKYNGEKISAKIIDESQLVFCLDSCQYVQNMAYRTIFVGCEKECGEFATYNSLHACTDCPLDGCKARLQGIPGVKIKIKLKNMKKLWKLGKLLLKKRKLHRKKKKLLRKTKKLLRKPKKLLRKTKKLLRKPKKLLRKTKKALRKPKKILRKTKKALRKPKKMLGKTKKALRKPKKMLGKTKKAFRKPKKMLGKTKKALRKPKKMLGKTKKALGKTKKFPGKKRRG